MIEIVEECEEEVNRSLRSQRRVCRIEGEDVPLHRKSERLHGRETVTRRGFYMRHRRAGTNRTRRNASTPVHVRNDALDRSSGTRGFDPPARTHGDKCRTGDDALRVLQNGHPARPGVPRRHV